MSVYAPFMEFQPDRVAGAVARSARAAPKSGFVADFSRVGSGVAVSYLRALTNAPAK